MTSPSLILRPSTAPRRIGTARRDEATDWWLRIAAGMMFAMWAALVAGMATGSQTAIVVALGLLVAGGLSLAAAMAASVRAERTEGRIDRR